MTQPSNDQMTLAQLQERYNYITNAIQTYQEDERRVWNQIVTMEDPTYSSIDQNFANQLSSLQNDRQEIMRVMMEKYNQNTVHHDIALKMDSQQSHLQALQSDILSYNDQTLGNINTDLMTSIRNSDIAKEGYYKLKVKSKCITLTNVYFSILFLLLVGAYLLKNKIVRVLFVFFSVLVFLIWIIHLSILIHIYRKRYYFQKTEFNFPPPPPLPSDPVTTPTATTTTSVCSSGTS
jgi:hypothetical protein